MTSADYPNDFYLGRIYDHTTGQTGETPYLYEPEDLTTHAVVVGMTGSGKTGLCLDLMEEAALHNLPAILIDPKGDITNLLLHFPDLLPADFEPWVNPDVARREGQSTAEMAQATAELWRNGLAGWGIGSDRIRRLKESVYRTIYTPGSTAGEPISILASLRAPGVDWHANQESILEQIEGTVTALLGLVGLTNLDPVSSPEHILLAKIIQEAWQAGRDVDLGELIMQTQNPPFDKIGFFAVDQFFPPKDRFGLAMKLNSLVAAPSFQPWLAGEPLDVQSLLYAPDGKARHSIFYIAHLNDTERMFIVTLLYSAIETWMRSQAGTTSLRALVYFDEIFGYLPPTANPPSKKPMLRMLKQARAFGVGLVLATQNPVDIDYKALSNAGSWFIGRLQTERDKLRLLDGLQGAAGGGFDRQTADAMLSGLGKRVFLVNNVHDKKGPQLFQTRWAMDYLAGPMTRSQLADLNALAEHGPQAAAAPMGRRVDSAEPAPTTTGAPPAPAASAPAVAAPSPLDDYPQTRGVIPSGYGEYFLPVRHSVARALENADRADARDVDKLGLVYQPALFMQADVLYTDRKGSFSEDKRYAVLVTAPDDSGRIRFEEYAVDAVDPRDLDSRPEPDARFADLGLVLGDGRRLKALGDQYVDHVYREKSLTLLENPTLKLTSMPGDSADDFRRRCEDAADDLEDAEVEKVQSAYKTKIDRLQDRLRKEERELAEDEAKLQSLKMETMARYGETIFNIANSFLGGRRRRVSGVSSALSKSRQQQTAKQEVEESEAEIAALKKQLEELAAEQEAELKVIDDKWAAAVADVTTTSVAPFKKNIRLELQGVAWQPFWLLDIDGRVRLVPAG